MGGVKRLSRFAASLGLLKATGCPLASTVGTSILPGLSARSPRTVRLRLSSGSATRRPHTPTAPEDRGAQEGTYGHLFVVNPVLATHRAKVVLMAAAGARDKEIAAKLKITPEKAARWRIGLPISA